MMVGSSSVCRLLAGMMALPLATCHGHQLCQPLCAGFGLETASQSSVWVPESHGLQRSYEI